MKQNQMRVLKCFLIAFLLISSNSYSKNIQGTSVISENDTIKYNEVNFSLKKTYVNITANNSSTNVLFCLLRYKDIEMRIVSDPQCYSCAYVLFLINNKAISQWENYAFATENLNTDVRNVVSFYYSAKNNNYYIIFEPNVEEGIPLDVYAIKDNNLVYSGYYIPTDTKNADCFYCHSYNKFANAKVYTINDKLHIKLVDTSQNTLLKYNEEDEVDNKQGIKENINNDLLNPSNNLMKSLKNKVFDFDWGKSFSSSSVFYKEFSFYEYGISEKYKIDWDKREIIPLNKAARFFLDSVVEMDPKIRFSKDTLIIGYVYYERNWEYTYLRSYYFLKSDDLNDVILNKVILDKEVAADLNAVGTNAPIATLKVKYLYDDFGNISFHDFDEIGSPYKISTDSFPLESYNRDLTLSELVKIVSNKKDVYRYNQEERIFGSGYSSFYIYPKPEEIFLRLKKTPLTLQTVEDYNNIAYYILEFAKSHEQADSYTDAAVKLLEKIIVQFPDRVVTYLNLGDAYWQRDYNGDRSKARTAYKKYIELMQAQQKDMNRIPKRVPERIGSNK